MAIDYGDEAGSKMIDDFMRFAERMGERAKYARAAQMQKAFQNATRSAQEIAGAGAGEREQPEWAKLDMQKFQRIEDYDAIKGIIEDRLAAHSVSSVWFPDPETGKEYLLFRIADAKEVWQSFDELSRETDDACAKAAEKIKEQHDKSPSRDRDDRTLYERAEDAREASTALEAERSTTKALSKEPRSRRCGRSDSGRHHLGGGPLGHILSRCERIHRLPAVASRQPHLQPHRSANAASLLSQTHPHTIKR